MASTSPLLQPRRDEEKGGAGDGGGGTSTTSSSSWSGDCVKSIVYAGLDAIVTSFSLISSISANRQSSVDVLVIGFANLVADAISMGFGDYVSSSTERDMAERERAAMERSITTHPGPQQSELLATYRSLGMDSDDAATVVRVLSKYTDIMVDEKMTAQKGMLPPRQSDKPWKSGLTTLAAFIIFGSVPLLSFIVLIPFTRSDSIKFLGACVLSAIALALLGTAKARISGQKYLRSIFMILFNGCIAAACAYLIGWTLRNVAGLQE